MAVTINADNGVVSGSAGLKQAADSTGILALQTNGTTAVTVDASQRAAFVAGTAALPAITTTGDTNTGIFFPAADTIAFAEGGAEVMRIDSSGNVGIGTASPSTYSGSNLVSFYSGGNNFAGLTSINSNSGTGIGGIQFGSDSTYVKAAIGLLRSGANGQGSLVFYNDSNADAANWATTDEKMRIDASGNVGIGQSSITQAFGNYTQLNISGSSGATIQMQTGATNRANIVADGNALYIAGLSGAIAFGVNGTGTGTEVGRFGSTGLFQFNSGYGSVATAYGCRAWVNFNGVTTATIRASGNVSSVTRNAQGDYTINFATAMPDTSYSIAGIPQNANQMSIAISGAYNGAPTTFTTGAVRVNVAQAGILYDCTNVCMSFFR